ncbi:unnamed protein product [Penicillium pancosmium]
MSHAEYFDSFESPMDFNTAFGMWTAYDSFSYFPPLEDYENTVAGAPTLYTGDSFNEEQVFPVETIGNAAQPTVSSDAHMTDVRDDHLSRHESYFPPSEIFHHLAQPIEHFTTTIHTLTQTLESKMDAFSSHIGQMEIQMNNLDFRLDKMNSRFDNMDGRFDHMDSRFEEIDSWLAKVDSQFDCMNSRLEKMDCFVEKMDASITTLHGYLLEVVKHEKGFLEKITGFQDVINSH